MSPDGPEEREFDANEAYECDIDDADVAEQLADEARHFIDWPTPILVYPVQLSAPEYTDEKLIALARQRLAMEDVTKLHPIFEQALAPFLKPVATRNDNAL